MHRARTFSKTTQVISIVSSVVFVAEVCAASSSQKILEEYEKKLEEAEHSSQSRNICKPSIKNSGGFTASACGNKLPSGVRPPAKEKDV